MYSLGNIISLCSTCFLYGPWTQAKKMFAPTRWRTISLSSPFFKHTSSIIFHRKSYRYLLPTQLIFVRLLATGVYLFFLVLTMFLAFYPHKIFARGLLLVISIAIQFLALCKCLFWVHRLFNIIIIPVDCYYYFWYYSLLVTIFIIICDRLVLY